jgi:hypothetical protein
MFTKSAESLSSAEERLLLALSAGHILGSHRFLSGRKVFKLTSSIDGSQRVSPAAVESLRRRELIYTNFKFPAATYSLTDRGRRLAAQLGRHSRAT